MLVRPRSTPVSGRLIAVEVPRDLHVSLTASERRILLTVVECGQVRTAAQVLGLSHHTVKNRLDHVYKKLQVGSRSSAIVRAVQLGLIEVEGLPR